MGTCKYALYLYYIQTYYISIFRQGFMGSPISPHITTNTSQQAAPTALPRTQIK
jgi:hypothetical protein